MGGGGGGPSLAHAEWYIDFYYIWKTSQQAHKNWEAEFHKHNLEHRLDY